MNRKRFIYFTNLVLVPLFILSLYSGIKLHIAGHENNHELWHDWAVIHTVFSLLFTLFGALHVKAHWGWYKRLKVKSFKDKRKVVLILSFAFVFVIVTGIMLLFNVEGANSSTGLLHYKTGIVMGILGILHIVKRIHFLLAGYAANLKSSKQKPG